jgi:hypothetical protein
MQFGQGVQETHTEFLWGSLLESGHLQGQAEYGRIALKWILKQQEG